MAIRRSTKVPLHIYIQNGLTGIISLTVKSLEFGGEMLQTANGPDVKGKLQTLARMQ
jgi:hypothetical protein